jgi:hypothetical protein
MAVRLVMGSATATASAIAKEKATATTMIPQAFAANFAAQAESTTLHSPDNDGGHLSKMPAVLRLWP